MEVLKHAHDIGVAQEVVGQLGKSTPTGACRAVEKMTALIFSANMMRMASKNEWGKLWNKMNVSSAQVAVDNIVYWHIHEIRSNVVYAPGG